MDFSKRVREQFPSLFGGGATVGDFDHAAQFQVKWGWYTSFYGLAGGDYFKIDRATKEPLLKALTFLTFEKDKHKTNNRIAKQG